MTYLNSAQKHPLHVGAVRALIEYANHNLHVVDGDAAFYRDHSEAVIAAFADLINATPYEVAFVPSTMTAENLIVAQLGFPGTSGNIITDSLHYDGSLYLYERLAQKGVEVRTVPQRDGRIDLAVLAGSIDKNTRLVAISLVSFANGFLHDLSALCEVAHANGALVYADIVQAAGAVPIDVRASGVDLCAASTHKWMMGDKGIGFLYVRKDLLDSRRMSGTQYGWKQIADDDFTIFRAAGPAASSAHYQIYPGTAGAFEVGTYALGPMMCAGASLAYIRSIGVERIRAHAATLARRLRKEMPNLGYASLSPPEAPGHVSAFYVQNRTLAADKLSKAGVKVRFTQNFMRVSVSVFNDAADIDKLLNALA